MLNDDGGGISAEPACQSMLVRIAHIQLQYCLKELPGQKLGITVQPAQIRLLPRHDDLYCWKWLPGKSYLFSKNLSDHSTGAYKELYKGVGVTFEAAPAEHLTEKPFTSPDARLSVNVSPKG